MAVIFFIAGLVYFIIAIAAVEPALTIVAGFFLGLALVCLNMGKRLDQKWLIWRLDMLFRFGSSRGLKNSAYGAKQNSAARVQYRTPENGTFEKGHDLNHDSNKVQGIGYRVSSHITFSGDAAYLPGDAGGSSTKPSHAGTSTKDTGTKDTGLLESINDAQSGGFSSNAPSMQFVNRAGIASGAAGSRAINGQPKNGNASGITNGADNRGKTERKSLAGRIWREITKLAIQSQPRSRQQQATRRQQPRQYHQPRRQYQPRRQQSFRHSSTSRTYSGRYEGRGSTSYARPSRPVRRRRNSYGDYGYGDYENYEDRYGKDDW